MRKTKKPIVKDLSKSVEIKYLLKVLSLEKVMSVPELESTKRRLFKLLEVSL